jgi:hypothetical protein
MRIEGKCHCGNITFVFHWPGDDSKIPVRACGCSFCVKHCGTYTSHLNAELSAVIRDEALVSKYRFGTGTADFFVCSQCGVVPFVVSEIQGHQYAVVNVNTFDGVDQSIFQHSSTNFDGEDTESRLNRRRRTWIPSVTIEKRDP